MDITGKIVDIKRFAIHDGPGIRTTVFLKGCPLHCLWCHNPESIGPKPEIGLIEGKCKKCGSCIDVCPENALSLDNGSIQLDRERCTSCGECVKSCYHGALEYYGKNMTQEEVAVAALEDEIFYKTSGGGVTVSGGEPLLQADFCRCLFERLKGAGIHCAIDTCGFVHWDAIAKVLQMTDLFLFDLKHIDSEKHKKATGVPNELILGNLRCLSETDKPIEIRMPVIPTINDSDRDIIDAGKFLSELNNIAAVRLLPYHALARSKYKAIGRKDTMPEVDSPTMEKMEHIAGLLKQCGINKVNI